MKTPLAPKKEREYEALFKALGDLTRLRLLLLLARGALCVRDLQESLRIIQPSVSRHLQILKRAGLVTGKRDEKRVYYSISAKGVSSLRHFPLLLDGLAVHPRGLA